MQQTTVDNCSLVDGSSDLEENIFSLDKDFVIWVQLEKQTSTLFAASHRRIVFKQMSCKPEDTKELTNDKNKHFGLGA